MNFDYTDDQRAIREGVAAVASGFGDDYWRARDEDGKFPVEFHRAMADGGWLGITMPEEYGGAALGVTEAAIMMTGCQSPLSTASASLVPAGRAGFSTRPVMRPPVRREDRKSRRGGR